MEVPVIHERDHSLHGCQNPSTRGMMMSGVDRVFGIELIVEKILSPRFRILFPR